MKRFLLPLLFIICALQSYSQYYDPAFITYDTVYVADTMPINAARKGHYIVASAGAGLNGLSMKIGSNGSVKQGIGITGQAGYRYFFTKNWGIGAALGFSTFTTATTLQYTQNLKSEMDERALESLDTSYRKRDYQAVFSELEETINLSVIQVPVGLYFQAPIGKKLRLGLGGNVTAAYIVSQKYETKSGALKNAAYYEVPKLQIIDLPDYGFTEYTDFSDTPDLKKIALGVGGELQFQYPITKKFDITLSFAGTYFITNQKNQDAENLWDTQTDNYIGVTQVNYCTKVNLSSATASIGIRYKMEKKPKPVIVERQLPPPPPDSLFVAEEDPVKDEHYERNADDYGINIMPQDYTFVNSGLDMTKQLSKRHIGEPIGTPIHFALNSDQLADSTNTLMDTVVTFLKENPDVTKIEIAAHTDNIGSDAYNLDLSKRRANTVARYIIRQGIDPKRIKTTGYGESRPLNDNGDDKKREINRRVEFIILELDDK